MHIVTTTFTFFDTDVFTLSGTEKLFGFGTLNTGFTGFIVTLMLFLKKRESCKFDTFLHDRGVYSSNTYFFN